MNLSPSGRLKLNKASCGVVGCIIRNNEGKMMACLSAFRDFYQYSCRGVLFGLQICYPLNLYNIVVETIYELLGQMVLLEDGNSSS